VRSDGVLIRGDRAVYRWTFIGTNTGLGGTGGGVRFSGFEVWRIGGDGLIAESRRHLDSAAINASSNGAFRNDQGRQKLEIDRIGLSALMGDRDGIFS
jgi:hypothetical protein